MLVADLSVFLGFYSDDCFDRVVGFFIHTFVTVNIQLEFNGPWQTLVFVDVFCCLFFNIHKNVLYLFACMHEY